MRYSERNKIKSKENEKLFSLVKNQKFLSDIDLQKKKFRNQQSNKQKVIEFL